MGGAAAEAVQPGKEELEETFVGVESAFAYGEDDEAAEGGPAGQQVSSFSGRSDEWFRNYFQQEIKAETAARDFLAFMLSLG